MTRTAYPRVNGRTDDTQYAELFDLIIGTGVRDADGLVVSADSTGLNVKVSTGFAVIAGNAFKSDAVEALLIPANSTANPRIDTVVLRRDFSASGLVVDLAVKPGQPGTQPVAPSLEQDVLGVWEEPLADVRVDANAATLASGTVTDRRRLTSVPVRTWTTATRPSGRLGALGLNRTTGQWEAWDGNGWNTPNFDTRYYRKDEVDAKVNDSNGRAGNAQGRADDAWNRANNAQGRADYAAGVAEGRATYDYVNGVRSELYSAMDNGRIDWRSANIAEERISARGLYQIAGGGLNVDPSTSTGGRFTTSVGVSIPGRMGTPQVVVLTPASGAVAAQQATVDGVWGNGFGLRYTRDNRTTTFVHWLTLNAAP